MPKRPGLMVAENLGMANTVVQPHPPVTDYFGYWIDQLQCVEVLPSALANRAVRAAIHAAPPTCRPSPIEAWMFELATDHGNFLNGPLLVRWLRLRRVVGDTAGVLDPATARYWYQHLGVPPRLSPARWRQRCRAVAHAAEPLGFSLSPRLLTAFCDHPAWTRPYLCCADFKAELVAANDPELAVPPPPPSPWPVSASP